MWGGAFTTCRFYLAPDNARLGILMKEGALGLLTYSAKWIPKR